MQDDRADQAGGSADLRPLVQVRLLRDRDLNAALVLAAIARLGSVSGAAIELGMSQPSVSRVLEKLRRQLDDPLFLRSGNRMIPTARLRRIQPQLKRLIADASAIFVTPQAFRPEDATADLHVAVNGTLQQVIAPRMIAAFRTQAPGLRLNFVPAVPEQVAQELESGRLDVAIGVVGYETLLRQQTVLRDRLVCVGSRMTVAALDARPPLTLAELSRLPQFDLSPSGQGLLQRLLVQLFEPCGGRNLVGALSSVLTLGEVIAQSDCVGFLPAHALRNLAFQNLSPLRLAFDLPMFLVDTYWHNATHGDPCLRWVRQQIAAICADVETETAEILAGAGTPLGA